ncbi:MAG: hypothetical protein ACI9QV_001335 [Methylophagaceae bacterium]|jgi:hypothetical protein
MCGRKKYYGIIGESLPKDLKHIKRILNQTRLIRKITNDSKDKLFDEIKGGNA